MHIVLDASAIISENYGRSTQFRTLLLASTALDYRVCVPNVAMTETVAKFSRDFDRDFNLTRRELGKLAKLLDRRLDPAIADLALEVERETFESSLVASLNYVDATFLEYPTTAHQEVAHRAVSRKRPFNDKGSGYRDTLIWLSALDLARQTEGQIILLTEDGDFGNDEGLHKDLIDDLVREGHQEDKIRLFRSLSEVIDQHIRPNLTAVIAENPLKTLAGLNVDTEEAILLAIHDSYSNVEWEPDELGLPLECQSPNLYYVEAVENPTVLEVRELPDDKLLIMVQADVHGGFNFYMLTGDWFLFDDDPRLSVFELDWNDHGLAGEVTLELIAHN